MVEVTASLADCLAAQPESSVPFSLDVAPSQLLGPVFLAGVAIASIGLVGLARLMLAAAWQNLSMEMHVCIVVALLGASCMTADLLQRFFVGPHVHVHRYMTWMTRACERFYLATQLPGATAQDVQLLLSGVFPLAAAMLRARNVRAALHLLLVAATGGNVQTCLVVKPFQRRRTLDLAVAMTWLREKLLVFGINEQVHLYGLSRQAACGDCMQPVSWLSHSLHPLTRVMRRSWENQRGKSRPDATQQLVRRLAHLDPSFRAAYPRFVESTAPSEPRRGLISDVVDMAKLVCRIVETRAPSDLDVIVVRSRRAMLKASVLLWVLRLLWRRPQVRAARDYVQRTPVGTFASLWVGVYLLSLNFGLPPWAHAMVPATWRSLPARVELAVGSKVGDPLPRVCRWATSVLIPPVRGSIFDG